MSGKKLSDAVFNIAMAFLILHADLNFGRINCLPDWMGYAMIIKTLDTLSEEEPSAELLRPLGYLLVGWNFVTWVFDFFGKTLNGYGIAVIVSVVRLYFEFQLLTNLAGIAEKYAPQFAERILRLRSMMTVVITGFTLYTVFEPAPWVTMVVAVVYLAAASWTCKVLVDLQKVIRPESAEEETPFHQRIRENAEAYDQMK